MEGNIKTCYTGLEDDNILGNNAENQVEGVDMNYTQVSRFFSKVPY